MFFDANANGRQDRGDSNLSGILVQLLDVNGNVIDSTHTSRNGTYRFNGLDLGRYQVRVTLPAGLRATTPDPATVQITRGGSVSVNFGLTSNTRPQPTISGTARQRFERTLAR